MVVFETLDKQTQEKLKAIAEHHNLSVEDCVSWLLYKSVKDSRFSGPQNPPFCS